MDITKEIKNGWHLAKNSIEGRNKFSDNIGKMVPYSGTVFPLVDTLEDRHCKIILNDVKQVRNHLDSIHALALGNIGELATGLSVIYSMPGNCRGILKSINANYLKKARGTLISECFCPEISVAKNTEFALLAKITDESGDLVCEVIATWVIGPCK